MARSSIRASLPEDIPALHQLMTAAGSRLPNSEPESLHWKYWRERPDWPGPRSFVMSRGNEILAHAGVVPGAFLFGDARSGVQRVRALHIIDWAARPTAIGAGASLMKHLGQSTDALLAIGGSAETLRLLPHLGFRPLGTGHLLCAHAAPGADPDSQRASGLETAAAVRAQRLVESSCTLGRC